MAAVGPSYPVRVHDIFISGNTKTKVTLIQSEVEELLRGANTFQELQYARDVAEERLLCLGIFEFVNIRFFAGPPELPGTVYVVIEVTERSNLFARKLRRSLAKFEPSNPFAGKLRSLAKFGARSYEGIGFIPRIEAFGSPLSGQINLLSKDCFNLSSYKERALILSLGLLSSGNHHLSYCHFWGNNPSQPRRHCGHNLVVPSLRYSFKIDQRDSVLRPTRGSSFCSNTQIGGQFRSLCFIRQDVDLNHAIPLGFCGAALNLRVLAGVVFRFPVSGFRASLVNGNLFLSALADLSFDLPSKLLRDAGISGHFFATTGCRNVLPENPFGGFSLPRLKDSYCAVGAGFLIPTRLFGMQVNYSYFFKPWDHGQEKSGIEFTFSSEA